MLAIEFEDYCRVHGVVLAADVEISSLVFGDFGCFGVEHLGEQMRADPSLWVRTRVRYLVFARLNGEIRYYAGPRLDKDPDVPVPAGDESGRPWEMGTLSSIPDAVSLAFQYVAGARLCDIRVPRTLAPHLVKLGFSTSRP